MILNVYFNPYPGISTDKESAKDCLLSTAKSFKQLSDHIKIKAHDPEGWDAVKCFRMFMDNHGAYYTPTQFIHELSGKDRALVTFLFRSIDKGSILYNDALSLCEDLALKGFGCAAPVLEYALRNDGMALTISDDNDWKCDFFYFIGLTEELPNIHGQSDCSPLIGWISSWEKRNATFIEILENRFKILFAPGAFNSITPNRQEENGIIEAFEKKKDKNFYVDNDIIKSFNTKHGLIFELRSYEEGVRVFFSLHNQRPVIGGFYRKSCSISQNKAGEQAAKRLKNNGYLS